MSVLLPLAWLGLEWPDMAQCAHGARFVGYFVCVLPSLNHEELHERAAMLG